MRGIDFRSLFLAALAAFTLTPAFAAAQVTVEVIDADNDSVPDDRDRCVESSPILELDDGVIGPDGCWVNEEACIAFRLQNGGNSRACGDNVNWDLVPVQAYKHLQRRERHGGGQIYVNGNSVDRRGDDLVCDDPDSILYVYGKGIRADGTEFESGIYRNQPPVCDSFEYHRWATVEAVRPGVTRSEMDEATGDLANTMAQIRSGLSGQIGEVRDDVGTLQGTVANHGSRIATLEGYFADGGVVPELAKQVLQVLGIAVEGRTLARTANRRINLGARYDLSARWVFNGWVVGNEAGLHPRYDDYVVNIQPLMGLDLGVLGVSVQPTDWLMVRAALYGRLLFTSRIAAGSSVMGLGAGGDASVLFRIPPAKCFLALGFNLTAGGDVRNVVGLVDSQEGAKDTVLASPTGYVTPAFQALVGSENVQFDGRIGAAGNWASMPDGTTATGASLFATLGLNFRFGGKSVQVPDED